ncbi:hypothetical protein [Paenibacillus jilunlii]|nr:hypothetical protein [Paenibacillus jilunlii]
MSDGSGVTGHWKVYVTTEVGHKIDISVEAGQPLGKSRNRQSLPVS